MSDGRSEMLSARLRIQTSKITSSIRRYSSLTMPLYEQDISRKDLQTTIPQTSITIRSITPSISIARRSRSRRSKGRSRLARTTSRATASTSARDVLLWKQNVARVERLGLQERKNTRDSTLDVWTIYRSYSSSTLLTSTGTILRRSSTVTISRLGLPTITGCQSPIFRSSTTAIGTINSFRPTNEPIGDGLVSDLGGYSRRSTRIYSLRASTPIKLVCSTWQIRPTYSMPTNKRLKHSSSADASGGRYNQYKRLGRKQQRKPSRQEGAR